MPLTNFGGILNFAAEIEGIARTFYTDAARNDRCAAHAEMFRRFADDTRKNLTIVERTRRENVTEMILEPIADFNRAPYCIQCDRAADLDASESLAVAREMEETAQRYYTAAAGKLGGLPEVARAMRRLAKTRAARLEELKDLAPDA